LGHEVVVFTTNAGLEQDAAIPTDRPVVRNGVTVHYFPSRFNFMGLQSSELEAAVRARAGEFDVIHVTGVWQPTSVAACRAAEAAGVPYVVSPRGALSPYSFGQKAWKKWVYWWLFERRNCNRASIIHYTASLEMREGQRLGLRAHPVIVPNAIDLSAWSRDEAAGRAWRERIGVREGEAVLLYAGRLHHKKGLDLLPSALAGMAALRWCFVTVGDDEDSSGAALQNELGNRGLADRCVFLPATDSSGLRAAYSGADLFLLPSRHENFGNVAVEALACGCPVLLSDQVGAADELSTFAGVRVAARSPESWADAITSSLASPASPKSEAIRARFAPDTLAAAMLEAYKTLLA
jgi:glycosyltransferase involved in cell wall biosynthesis